MKWGIAFEIPAIQKTELFGLPPPSHAEEVQWYKSEKMIRILYHFLYPPQGRKEWQRVAGIKVKIQKRCKHIQFIEYEHIEVSGKIYTVSELGKHFQEPVKFPTPFMEGTPQATLTRHAKRLYYEGMLHIEQLIFVSMWIKEIAPKGETGRRKKDEGIRQVMRRAKSAYKFALDHLDEWSVKLSDEERHKVLSQSALKAAQVKRAKSEEKRVHAKQLQNEGETLSAISSTLGVSKRTIQRWLKQ